MIINSIIGMVITIITTYILLINYKRMMIFSYKKLISIILIIILLSIIISCKSLLGYFNIVTQVVSGILNPITIAMLLYIFIGKKQSRN